MPRRRDQRSAEEHREPRALVHPNRSGRCVATARSERAAGRVPARVPGLAWFLAVPVSILESHLGAPAVSRSERSNCRPASPTAHRSTIARGLVQSPCRHIHRSEPRVSNISESRAAPISTTKGGDHEGARLVTPPGFSAGGRRLPQRLPLLASSVTPVDLTIPETVLARAGQAGRG